MEGFVFFPKETSSNLPFGVMMASMSSMSLHDIVIQHEDAGAQGGTDGRRRTGADTDGHLRTVWATRARCGGRQGGRMPLYEAMVVLLSSSRHRL